MAEDDAITTIKLELEDGYRFRVDFGEDLAPLFVDEPAPLGNATGPNASAVLAAAVGNCLSASLILCLSRAHVDVEGLQAEVAVTRARNEQGRQRISSFDVVLRPTIEPGNEGRFERCVDLFEDYCVVTESVRHGIEVSVRVDPSTTGQPLASPSDDASGLASSS